MPTASGHTSAIRAKKVLGTTIKSPSGEKIGSVEDIVLDKLSNNIMFAIVSFGGFLGIGERYHAIPWSGLDYDKQEEAYIVQYTKEQLSAGPADTVSELTKDDGQTYREKSYTHYNVSRDW